jgi:hypothetical protein
MRQADREAALAAEREASRADATTASATADEDAWDAVVADGTG